MGQIPSESRAAIAPLLRIVGGARSRTLSTKDAGTLLKRKYHFINFIEGLQLSNNVALAGFTLNVRNIIMSCYTAYLASGATLLCKTIKVDTIKRYLSAAAELSIPAQMVNPCLDLMGKTSVFIRNILYEARRWESMPDRREPVTKQMTEYIIDKGNHAIR